jgi:hypothetical protein
LRKASVLVILTLAFHLPTFAATAQENRVLRIAIDKKSADFARAAQSFDPADLVEFAVKENPDWIEFVSDDKSADVRLLVNRATSQSTGAKLWELELENKLSEVTKRKLPSLAAHRAFLAIDLERLYLIKNLAHLGVGDIAVSLKLTPDGRKEFNAGEELSFTITASQTGYISVINVDCNAKICLIFPQPGEGNRLEAGKTLALPSENYGYVVSKPYGDEYVRAICTKSPIDLSFLNCNDNADVDFELMARAVPSGSGRVGTAKVQYVTRKSED